MDRRRPYDEKDVRSIFRASEFRISRTGMTGHTGEKHVLITGEGMLKRAQEAYDQTRDGMIVRPTTAFCDEATAIRVVTEALSSLPGQDALGCLDGYGIPLGARVSIEARVQPFPARFVPHPDIKRTITIDGVFVLIESIWEGEQDYKIHIHTGFPITAFRRGQPAWCDHRNAWHP